jgi:hypothetical protein
MDRLENPEMRNGSSRLTAGADVDAAVGVTVGVLEPALSFSAWRRAPLVCKAAGKLAAEGTGEGLQDRKSAKDLALRKLLSALPKEFESMTSNRPTED